MMEIITKLINLELPLMVYFCLLLAVICLNTAFCSGSIFWKILAGICLGINIYSAAVSAQGYISLLSPQDDWAIYGILTLITICIYAVIKGVYFLVTR